MTKAALRVLVLPGWRGAGPDHWLTQWERAQPGLLRRVEQSDWLWPRRGDWMARLDDVLLADDGMATPAVLLAHGLGCQLVAAWAAHSSNAARVAGALLVDPLDTEADAAPQLHNWRPMVRQALPFASTVVTDADDTGCSPARSRELAAAWGSGWIAGGDRPSLLALIDDMIGRASQSRSRDPCVRTVPACGHRIDNHRPSSVTP